MRGGWSSDSFRTMARKTTPSSPSSPPSPPVQNIQIRPVIEATDNTPVFYANYLEVSISPNEFALSAVRIPTKPTQATLDSGEIRMEPSVQIIIPPMVIPGLIRALSTQRDNYESQFGPINDTGVPK